MWCPFVQAFAGRVFPWEVGARSRREGFCSLPRLPGDKVCQKTRQVRRELIFWHSYEGGNCFVQSVGLDIHITLSAALPSLLCRQQFIGQQFSQLKPGILSEYIFLHNILVTERHFCHPPFWAVLEYLMNPKKQKKTKQNRISKVCL